MVNNSTNFTRSLQTGQASGYIHVYIRVTLPMLMNRTLQPSGKRPGRSTHALQHTSLQ